jgi:hypothetical protein
MDSDAKRQQLQLLRIVSSFSSLLMLAIAGFLYYTQQDLNNLNVIVGALIVVSVIELVVVNLLIAHKLRQIDRDDQA